MGPVQFGASNMRSFFEQSRLLQAHDKVQAGQYFFTKAGDQDWPVVICDEDIVKRYFNVRKRPDHARLADGTWGKDYEPGGKHADRRSYPALVPGQLTLQVLNPNNEVQS